MKRTLSPALENRRSISSNTRLSAFAGFNSLLIILLVGMVSMTNARTLRLSSSDPVNYAKASPSLSQRVNYIKKSDEVSIPNNAAPQDSSSLSSLVISYGALNPVFSPETTDYSIGFPNSVTSVTLTAVSLVSGATIKINGTAVASGSSSQAINLPVGTNNITLVVTSPDGTKTKTYNMIAVRAAASPSNANLVNISLSRGVLSPSFSATTVNYTSTVGFATSSVTVSPTTNMAAATVTVNGVAVNSSSPSGDIPLQVGNNLITIRVTAQDGSTVKTYKVSVSRPAASHDASLASLVGSVGGFFAGLCSGYHQLYIFGSKRLFFIFPNPYCKLSGSYCNYKRNPGSFGYTNGGNTAGCW